jgi:uncharacterized protein DUF2510
MDIRPFLGLPPGWYVDEADSALQRYWDGSQIVGEVHWDGTQWVEWWQASDGAFYPPELHPSDVQVDPAPTPLVTAEPFTVSSEAAATPSASARPRRHGRALVFSAIGVAAVVLVVGLVVGVGGQNNAEATVLNAVNSTLADKTANISFTMDAGADGATVNATGTGGIDFTQNAMQMDLSMDAGGQTIDLQAEYLGGTVYESIPQIPDIEPGKSWISMDLSSMKSVSGTGASGSLSVQGNPAEMLRMLSQHGNTVAPIGASTVGGVSVQGYAVTISAAKIRSELANVPDWMRSTASNVGFKAIDYKVYIDDEGLLRRTTISMGLTADGTSVTMNEFLDFSDYGSPVNVSAPPADQVVSFQQFLQDAQQASG